MRTTVLARILAAWAASGLATASAATVRIQVVDDATGKATAARVYLWRGDEPVLPPGFPAYSAGDERHFLVEGPFRSTSIPGRTGCASSAGSSTSRRSAS